MAKNKRRNIGTQHSTRRKTQSSSADTPPWQQAIDPRTVLTHLPYLCFITLLAVIYIWNTHHTNRTARKIDKLEKTLQKKRWRYMTTQTELMNISKQSKMVDLVRDMKLKPLKEPPQKISIDQK